MLKIGSFFWRLYNYGIIAAIKYLIFSKFWNLKKIYHQKYEVYRSFTEFCDNFIKLDLDDLRKVESIINHNIKFLGKELEHFNNSISNTNSKSINNLLYENSTRLKVLGYLIASRKFDCIIETGTQSGLSAFFMEAVANSMQKKDSLKIISFDVKRGNRLIRSTEVEFIILKKRIRNSFKILSSYFSKSYDSILFFHDSDHTYENMTFEFDWAWNQLKVDFLVSDDVSENTAFTDFTTRYALNPILCRFDNGSQVGIVERIK